MLSTYTRLSTKMSRWNIYTPLKNRVNHITSFIFNHLDGSVNVLDFIPVAIEALKINVQVLMYSSPWLKSVCSMLLRR